MASTGEVWRLDRRASYVQAMDKSPDEQPTRGQAWVLEVLRQAGGESAMIGWHRPSLNGCIERDWVTEEPGGVHCLTPAGREALARYPANPRPT